MDRRSHYIETALLLFAEQGYNGVSMDELVTEAGGSKATLYRYFPSKRDLFLAIIDDLSSAAMPGEMADELDRLDLEAALTDLGQRVATAALSERATVLFRLASGEAQRFPELGQVLFDHGPAVSYERLRRLIETRVAAGELVVEDAEIAAEQFIGGIVGHQQLRMALGVSRPTPAAMEARVQAAVRTFVAAYASR